MYIALFAKYSYIINNGVNNMLKTCKRCFEELPADFENFPMDVRNSDGLSSYCKQCAKLASMKTRAKYKGLTLEEYVQEIENKKIKRLQEAELKIQIREKIQKENQQNKEETLKKKQERLLQAREERLNKLTNKIENKKAKIASKENQKKIDDYFNGKF